MLSSKLSFLPVTLFQVVRFETFPTNRGHFFEMIILSINNPMLSSKFNFLSHNSFPSGQIWNSSFMNRGHFFFKMIVWVTPTLCYLQNLTFCPILLFISILFALCLHEPYILPFKCNFDSLEWQFGNYCFYVGLETCSKIKLMCVPTHYYWSIPFSAVNSIFKKTFSCVCQIHVAEVLIIHFLQLLPSKVFFHYEYQSEVNFCGGSTPDLDPAPDPYLHCTFWHEFLLYWYYVNPMLSSEIQFR